MPTPPVTISAIALLRVPFKISPLPHFSPTHSPTINNCWSTSYSNTTAVPDVLFVLQTCSPFSKLPTTSSMVIVYARVVFDSSVVIRSCDKLVITVSRKSL